MPSEKVLQVKQNYVAELAEKLKKSACGVLVDYSGITVADDTVLRKELREAGIDYFVVKNTLLKRAAEMAGVEGIEDVLEGTTALALAEEDIVTAPRSCTSRKKQATDHSQSRRDSLTVRASARTKLLHTQSFLQRKHCLHSWYLCFSPLSRSSLSQ